MPENLKPWRMALPLMGFVVICLLWSGYWLWASSQAQTRIAEWRRARAAQGVTITCAQERWGGYPFRIELSCTPGEIRTQGSRVQFTKLTVMAQAYDLKHVLLVNDGETVLNLGGGDVRFQHEGAIASLLVGKKGKAQFDAEFRNLAATGITAARLAFHARLDAALNVAVSLETANLQSDTMEPVSVDEMSISGSVNPVPQEITFEAIADSAATVTIGQLNLQSAAIRLSGTGEFTINGQARPEGKLKGRIENFDHVLQALADRGLLEENARMGAGAVLGLLGGNSPDGMRIELAATQGGLYIGPFRIADLPPLF